MSDSDIGGLEDDITTVAALLNEADADRLAVAHRILGQLLDAGWKPPKRKAEHHGTLQQYDTGCRCDRCRTAMSTYSKNWYAANADHVLRQKKQQNDKLLDQATNHYKQWTGPELDIVSREDLTIEQIAHMLNRSYYSVRGARRKLNNGDPRKRMLRDGPDAA